MNLEEIRQSYLDDGMEYLDASARTCQDVLLELIAKSPLAKNVTIKGGVVMQHISGDSRRATQDLDLDFIRYSISDEAIREFINKLNAVSKGVNITIVGNIEELKHQDYHGKRIYIRLTDGNGIAIDTKLDIGVHKNIDVYQEEYCFDLGGFDDCATLFVNTREQIAVEKLKTLLRIGQFSTRYKDIYDLHYLLVVSGVDETKLHKLIKSYVFDDNTMRENSMADLNKRVSSVLSNQRFIGQLNRAKKNWLDVPTAQVVAALLDYFKE
jgi:predicted nucleotidyltransferase component of viral defense system